MPLRLAADALCLTMWLSRCVQLELHSLVVRHCAVLQDHLLSACLGDSVRAFGCPCFSCRTDHGWWLCRGSRLRRRHLGCHALYLGSQHAPNITGVKLWA